MLGFGAIIPSRLDLALLFGQEWAALFEKVLRWIELLICAENSMVSNIFAMHNPREPSYLAGYKLSHVERECWVLAGGIFVT